MNLKRSEFLALMAAATSVTAIAVDTMLPAFGQVREHFGLETASDTALIITVFILGLGFGQLAYGPLSDRFGRKPVIRAGLTLYMVAGLATTIAPTFELLLIGRFVWGLGSAGPRIVTQAILRDRFQGDALSRALAVMFTIFLIVPSAAPLIGQLVLVLGSWRYTFAVGPVFAGIVFIWLNRLDETLAAEDRRSIAPRELWEALVTVVKTPMSVGNIVALTALSAAFLPYLSSSERIFDLIYGRGAEFFFWFSLNAALLAAFTLGSGWVVARIGSNRTATTSLLALLGVSGVFLALSLAAAGVPGFALFYVMTTLMVGFNVAARPTLTSQALEEVGHIAGTAASLIGATTLVLGSVLSAVIDRLIGDTITPFVAGFVVAALVGLVTNGWARRRQAVAARL